MMDIKKTKISILSYAFKGMLVESDNQFKKNDELKKIHLSINKYSAVTEDEWLTDAPKHWEWTRLGYVTCNHGQITPQEDFCYIDVGTLDNVNQKLAKQENIVRSLEAPSRARKVVEYGDVLYSTVRPYLHNICIVDRKFSKIPIASTAFSVMCVNCDVLINKFLFYWLISSEFDKFSNGNPSKGTLYPAIGEKDLLNGVIPLPSLKEQQSIVDIIESSFYILEKLDKLQSEYTTDLDALKSKIVDAAIQGKLTQRLESDGSVKELLNMIQEKAETILCIQDEDIPFDIAENWCWIKLGWVMDIERGGSPRPIKAYITTEENGINWIKIGDVAKDGKYIIKTKEKIKPEGEKKSRRVYPGDFLLTNSMSFGRPYISKIEGCVHDGWLILRNSEELFDLDFLYYLLSSSYAYNQFSKKASGSTVDNLNKDKVADAIIPLPPVTEQKRIVEKVEEVFRLVGTIDELQSQYTADE